MRRRQQEGLWRNVRKLRSSVSGQVGNWRYGAGSLKPVRLTVGSKTKTRLGASIETVSEFLAWLLLSLGESGGYRHQGLISVRIVFNPPVWHPHVLVGGWCAFRVSKNRPRCPVCAGHMKKNGTTSKGTTRWRCKDPNCGSSTTRTRSDRTQARDFYV